MYTNGTETLNHRALQNRLGISFPRGNPPEGWAVADTTPPEPTPEQLLARQKSQVRQDAEAAYAEPVTDANGITWAGGFDSAVKAKMGLDLGEFVGRTGATIYDVDDEPHEMSLGQAKMVAATIGGAYEAKHAAEKAAMRALRKIDLNAPDAKQQIEAVTFAAYLSTNS